MKETLNVRPYAIKSDQAMSPFLGSLLEQEQRDLVAAVNKTNLAWVTQAGQIQRNEMDFAKKLAQCTLPSEAVKLSGEWLAHRIDSAVSMQHQILELWINMVTSRMRQAVEAKVTDPVDGIAREALAPVSD